MAMSFKAKSRLIFYTSSFMVMFMLQINATTRIALAINPVVFRKGIDTLAAYCLKQVGIDPFSGRLFAFRNRAGTAVKLLI